MNVGAVARGPQLGGSSRGRPFAAAQLARRRARPPAALPSALEPVQQRVDGLVSSVSAALQQPVDLDAVAIQVFGRAPGRRALPIAHAQAGGHTVSPPTSRPAAPRPPPPKRQAGAAAALQAAGSAAEAVAGGVRASVAPLDVFGSWGQSLLFWAVLALFCYNLLVLAPRQ
jgi:hypothetical protein